MIARLGFFSDFDFTDRDYVVDTVRRQPACRGVYHLVDRGHGDGVSISLWDDEASQKLGQQAVADATRAGSYGGPRPDRVVQYEVVRSAPDPHCERHPMADSIADGYERWTVTGDTTVFERFSPDMFDHVSGRRGLDIFDTVWRWIEATLNHRVVEHHATMSDRDRLMIWYTVHGRHIGNGLPRLAGKKVSGAEVQWTQVHVFRVADGLVVEHWAVRDDYGLLEQID